MSLQSWMRERRERKARQSLEEAMFDDSSKTKGQRVKAFLKDQWNTYKWPAVIPATAALLYGAGVMSHGTLTPLQWYDCNHDGVKDAIVAFPLKGTKKAFLGYIDGTTMAGRASAPQATNQNPFAIQSAPVPQFEGSVFEVNFIDNQMIDRVYNDRWLASTLFIEDPRLNSTYEDRKDNPVKLDPTGTYLFMSSEYSNDEVLGRIE